MTSSNPIGRPATQNSGERREKILNEALKLFAAKGIAGSSIAEIAERSAVTPAMVHYYFGNKDSLIQKIVDEKLFPLVNDIWSNTLAAAEREKDHPEKIIEGLVCQIFNAIERLPYLPQLWSREVYNSEGLLRERLFKVVPMDKTAKVIAILQESQKAGKINAEVDVNIIFISIIGLVMLPLSLAGGNDTPLSSLVGSREKVQKHVLAILKDGILTKEGRP